MLAHLVNVHIMQTCNKSTVVGTKAHNIMQVILPNFLTKISIQIDADSPKRTPAKTDFHSPVRAFISAYVCRKVARYTVTLNKSIQSL